MVKLQCHLDGQIYTLPFSIAQKDVLPLLGLCSCIQMGLELFNEDVH